MFSSACLFVSLFCAALNLSACLPSLSGPKGVPISESRIAVRPSPTPDEADEVVAFFRRFGKPEHMNLLQGAMWTLTHDYKEKDNPEKVLDVVVQYQQAVEKWVGGDKAPLTELGGLKAYKEKIAAWLGWEDQSVRAFGALMLGIAGDDSYAPLLAEKMGEKCEDEYGCYDRARFAMALGMLNAVGYKPDVLKMLESRHDSDRAGAIWSLMLMKATDAAEKIASLQTDKDEGVREAAVEALKELGRSDLIRKN